MFNPFQAFQNAAKQMGDAVNQTAQQGGQSAPNALPGGMTGGMAGLGMMQDLMAKLMPTGSGQTGGQATGNDWAALFDPKKLFDPQTYRDMFPKELTQAWQSMSSNTWAQAMQQPLQAGAAAAPANAQTATTASAFPKGFDFSSLAAAQQKNMESLTSAQAAAVSGWQSLIKRQAEIFHDTLQTAASAMNELMAAGAPEDKLARQADLAKQAFDAAGKNVEELARLATQGQQEAMKVVSSRVQESLDELKRAAQHMPQQMSQGMQQGMQQAANSFTKTAQQTAQTMQQAATIATQDGLNTAAANLSATSDAVG